MHPVHVVAKANMTFPQYPQYPHGRNNRIRSRIHNSHPNISNNRSIRSHKPIPTNCGSGA